jgi:pyruvate dehydrogenase E1 component alpha subunit
MKRDPIEIFKHRLEEEGLLDPSDLEEMEAEAKALVDDAWDFADSSAEPPPEALYEDVYVYAADTAAGDE